MATRVRRQLTQCAADQLLKVAGRCGDQVDAAGALVALHRLARDVGYRESGRDRRLETLLGMLRSPMLRGDGVGGVRQLTNLAWALARLAASDEPLLDGLGGEAMARLDEFAAHDIASLSWALAKLEVAKPGLSDSILARSFELLPEFSTSQFANVAWFGAKMQDTAAPLVEFIALATHTCVTEAALRDLSGVAWAVATLRVGAGPLMGAIAAETAARVTELSPLDFANIAWSLSELTLPGAADRLAARASESLRGGGDGLLAQDMGRWLWAFAKMTVESAELLDAITADAPQKAANFTTQELTGLMWSLSRQAPASVDEGFVETLAREAARRAREFTGQQLATVASTLLKLGSSDGDILEVLSSAARENLRTFAPEDLAGLAWAVAQAGLDGWPLMQTMASEVSRRLLSFPLHELTSVVSAWATMAFQDRELIQSAMTEIVNGMPQMTAQDVSKISWACSKLLYVEEELLEALLEASIRHMSEFQPANLSNVIWSCAKLSNTSDALIDALCGSSMAHIGEFSAQNLANTVWSIATLNFTITEKMEEFVTQSIAKISEFGPQGLANTSWAFAKMEQKFDELMSAISQEAMAKASEFETQNLSNTSWAFATLRLEDKDMMMTLSSRITVRIKECTCRDLASTSWAFARIHMPNPSLLASMSEVLPNHLAEFEAKGLSNTAWALAILNSTDEPLLNALASQVVGKVRQCWADGSMKIEDLATDLNGLTWAMEHAGLLTGDFSVTILGLMRGLGRAKDFEMSSSTRPPPTHIDKMAPEDHPGDAPLLRQNLPDMCCIHKPAGWEVDNQDAGGGPWMSSWLMEEFTIDQVPIAHYEQHQFGIVQRLDIPSSGLVLVGKTWEGFYTLKWQLQTGNLTRDYVLLVHNWVEFDSRVNDQSFADKALEGAAAPAQLRVISHLSRPDEEKGPMSLVVMRVRKSRRSELRTHFAGAGHPTVADGKYCEREAYLRDREWCARKFMHCYHLEYRDSADSVHSCVEPLPLDLRESLAKLIPRGPESASAVEPWISGTLPMPWGEYPGLRASDAIAE